MLATAPSPAGSRGCAPTHTGSPLGAAIPHMQTHPYPYTHTRTHAPHPPRCLTAAPPQRAPTRRPPPPRCRCQTRCGGGSAAGGGQQRRWRLGGWGRLSASSTTNRTALTGQHTPTLPPCLTLPGRAASAPTASTPYCGLTSTNPQHTLSRPASPARRSRRGTRTQTRPPPAPSRLRRCQSRGG